jgi:hypothetical protein
MESTVEIFSATDPPHVHERRVWYWLEFEGRASERLTEWALVNEWALALVAEHDAYLLDRSDKGSGLLLATLSG